jgi:hypothetical protein
MPAPSIAMPSARHPIGILVAKKKKDRVAMEKERAIAKAEKVADALKKTLKKSKAASKAAQKAGEAFFKAAEKSEVLGKEFVRAIKGLQKIAKELRRSERYAKELKALRIKIESAEKLMRKTLKEFERNLNLTKRIQREIRDWSRAHKGIHGDVGKASSGIKGAIKAAKK